MRKVGSRFFPTGRLPRVVEPIPEQRNDLIEPGLHCRVDAAKGRFHNAASPRDRGILEQVYALPTFSYGDRFIGMPLKKLKIGRVQPDHDLSLIDDMFGHL